MILEEHYSIMHSLASLINTTRCRLSPFWFFLYHVVFPETNQMKQWSKGILWGQTDVRASLQEPSSCLFHGLSHGVWFFRSETVSRRFKRWWKRFCETLHCWKSLVCSRLFVDCLIHFQRQSCKSLSEVPLSSCHSISKKTILFTIFALVARLRFARRSIECLLFRNMSLKNTTSIWMNSSWVTMEYR